MPSFGKVTKSMLLRKPANDGTVGRAQKVDVVGPEAGIGPPGMTPRASNSNHDRKFLWADADGVEEELAQWVKGAMSGPGVADKFKAMFLAGDRAGLQKMSKFMFGQDWEDVYPHVTRELGL